MTALAISNALLWVAVLALLLVVLALVRQLGFCTSASLPPAPSCSTAD